MSDTIHLIYNSDANYMFPTTVSAVSAALQVTQTQRLVVHLLDCGASDEQVRDMEKMIQMVNPFVCSERHRIDVSDYQKLESWQGSFATYSRIFVPDILLDVDWAIYVDGDTLWLGDIGELWKLRDDSISILASVDPPTSMGTPNPQFEWYRERGLPIDEKQYFCAGLMLMNLRKMRSEGMTGQCRAFLEKYPAPYIVDQTVLNYVLYGKTRLLPRQWGVFSVWHKGIDLSCPACVHYAQDVPWARVKINRLLSDIVMLWFYFCSDVLGLNELQKSVPLFGRFWRRAVFIFLKHNQWLLFHPYVKSRLRNTHGIPKTAIRNLRVRWQDELHEKRRYVRSGKMT